MPDPSPYCICAQRDSCSQYNDVEHFVQLYAEDIEDYAQDLPILYHGLRREAEELLLQRMNESRNPVYDRCSPSAARSLRHLKDITDRIGQGDDLSTEDRKAAREHLATARIAISAMRRAMKGRS